MRVGGAEVLHRLAHGRARVEARALEHDAHPGAQLAVARGRIEAEHGHVAGAPLAVALEDLDRGGLARAVRPEQSEYLAAPHRERHTAHGLELAIALAQAVYLDSHFRHGVDYAKLRAVGLRLHRRRQQ